MFGRSRGQFFSFDVLAGAFIFMLAFFLLAFYWLNAQALFAQQETGDMQREAERMADQLLVPDDMGVPILTAYAQNFYLVNGGTPPAGKRFDQVYAMPVLSFGDGWSSRGPNNLNPWALSHFILMSNFYGGSTPDKPYFYNDMKEKLGIAKYNYYVTIEGTDGLPLTKCLDVIAGAVPGQADYRYGKTCRAGKNPADPDSNVKQVANAERIVIFVDYTYTGGTMVPSTSTLAKMRVQVWQ
ncbi:MAG: hypothetical protein WC759_05235 [Candidatus Micrarchaeia archaeon]|jgi:hypothetical protein